jgi:hypothetical protein
MAPPRADSLGSLATKTKTFSLFVGVCGWSATQPRSVDISRFLFYRGQCQDSLIRRHFLFELSPEQKFFILLA